MHPKKMNMKSSGFRQQSKKEIQEKRDKTKARRIASLKEKQANRVSKPKANKKSVIGQNKPLRAPSKPKVKTQAWLKKELDRVFSIYIRQKFSDSDGNNTCYTCGKAGTIKTMQNGHFVSRQYLATRWDENNCRIQCCGCNLFGNGKPLDFEERLKKDLGDDFVEEMKLTRHQSLKLDRNWYTAEIEKYKKLVK